MFDKCAKLRFINQIAICSSIFLIIFSGLYILGVVSLEGPVESYIQVILILLSAGFTVFGREHDLNKIAFNIIMVALIGVITMYGCDALLQELELTP
ncbi:hypothetical protein [Bacillus bombysepticus]|uniref:hypothetical protein n=1 Tax=Bacillus bombysepticus TaxID=658666 RepID=UPI003018FA68